MRSARWQRAAQRCASTLGLLCLVAVLGSPAAANAQAPGWQPGPEAVGDASAYKGFIDSPASGASVAAGGPLQVSGWFVDTTADGWAGADNVNVYDGVAGSGTLVASGSVGLSRPDVAAALDNPFWSAAGFATTVPAGALASGQHTLSVYLHTPGKGWWFEQVGITVESGAAAAASGGAAAAATGAGGATGGAGAAGASGAAGAAAATSSGAPVAVIREPATNETLLTKKTGTFAVQGFAFDPSASPSQGVSGSGVDNVHVVITDTLGSKIEGDADLGTTEPEAAAYGARWENSGFRFEFRPTGLHAGVTHVDVIAHSVVTGKTFSASQTFTIQEGD